MAANAGLAVVVTWLVMRSRFGYGLIAIRENEEAASVLGVNTTAYKVGAFALAAALTGLAGGIFAQWSSFIDQESVFPLQYNVQMILMAIIGGAGTLFGPVGGARVPGGPGPFPARGGPPPRPPPLGAGRACGPCRG